MIIIALSRERTNNSHLLLGKWCYLYVEGRLKHCGLIISRVSHEQSGRTLEIYSDQVGVQFYTGNFMPDPENNVKTNPYVTETVQKEFVLSNRFIRKGKNQHQPLRTMVNRSMEKME